MSTALGTALDLLSATIEGITPTVRPKVTYRRQRDTSAPLATVGQLRRFDFFDLSVEIDRVVQPQYYRLQMTLVCAYHLPDSSASDELAHIALADYADIFDTIAPQIGLADWSGGTVTIDEYGQGDVTLETDETSRQSTVQMTVPISMIVAIGD